MNISYIDVQARIQQARRERSDALGTLLGAGWGHCYQLLGKLFRRRTARRIPWLETPT